jgi:hypothetical protein
VRSHRTTSPVRLAGRLGATIVAEARASASEVKNPTQPAPPAAAGSYREDVQRVCFAEKNSGVDATKDTHKVEQYAKEHLDTPEGAKWFTELTAKGVADRASGLSDEAKRLGIADCPLVRAYVSVRANGEYQSDIYRLCSDLVSIEQYDDAGRLQQIVDWIHLKAKSPRTQELAEKLTAAPPPQRAEIVRQTSSDAAVYICELASLLSRPQSHPRQSNPIVAIGDPQINGSMKEGELVAALIAAEDDLHKCYDSGLAHDPNLSGRLMLNFVILPAGNVGHLSVEPSSTLHDRDVGKCVATRIKSQHFPAKDGPLNAVLLPLDFTPGLAAPAPSASASASSSAAPPAPSAPASASHH